MLACQADGRAGRQRAAGYSAHQHFIGSSFVLSHLQDVPALAVSLDNYAARSEEQYATAAAYTVAMMKAVLVRIWSKDQHPNGVLLFLSVPAGLHCIAL